MRTTRDLTTAEVYRYEATGELPSDVSDNPVTTGQETESEQPADPTPGGDTEPGDSLMGDDETIDPGSDEATNSTSLRRGRNNRGTPIEL